MLEPSADICRLAHKVEIIDGKNNIFFMSYHVVHIIMLTFKVQLLISRQIPIISLSYNSISKNYVHTHNDSVSSYSISSC